MKRNDRIDGARMEAERRQFSCEEEREIMNNRETRVRDQSRINQNAVMMLPFRLGQFH